MDEMVGVLIFFLAVVGFIGWIGYLIATYWMWILLVLAIFAAIGVLVVFVAGVSAQGSSRASSTDSPDKIIATAKQDRSEALNLAKGATSQCRQIQSARAQLETESQKVAAARSRMSGQLNLQILKQMHFQSRTIADQWYFHKKGAEASVGMLSRSVTTLERDRTKLASISGRQRSRAAVELDATMEAILSVRGDLSALSDEVRRGRVALNRHNVETGRLRDHIRDNCGPAGRRWYDDMQARIAARNQ